MNHIPMIEDYNDMLDLLELPETKQKYKYLVVIVDLATSECDFEPIKNKTPNDVKNALNVIFKRSYIKKPYASIQTDNGKEFKGEFNSYLYNSNILHKLSLPYRHTQNSVVEAVNRQLGRFLNGYMNMKEAETGKVYKEWTDQINLIRTELNKIRKKKLPDDIFTYLYPSWNAEKEIKSSSTKKKETQYEIIEPKYKKGDLVYVVLESPENALGKKQKGLFRNGDYKLTKEPHKITKVLYYHGPPYYRYLVNTFNGVSYQEAELKRATEEAEEKFKVKQIINKRTYKKVLQYKVWWKGYPKKEATWELAQNLIDDGLQEYIDAYEEEQEEQ
jgi:hypothetical protein